MKKTRSLRVHGRRVGIAAAILGGVLIVTGCLDAVPISYPPAATGPGNPTFNPLTNTAGIGVAPANGQSEGEPDGIVAGQADQPAANWIFGLSDSGTVTLGVTSETWGVGDRIDIPVFDSNGDINDISTGDFVEFAGKPTITCTGGGSGATQPTFSVALATDPVDTAGDVTAGLTDLLEITFTDNPSTQSPANFLCTISNVAYTTGPNTPSGPLEFDTDDTASATYIQGGAPANINPVGNDDDEQAIFVDANATVVGITVTANNPPVSVLPNAVNASISNVVLTEVAPGEVPPGYICLDAQGGDFTTSSTQPSLTVSPSSTGGTATIAGTVSGVDPQPDGGYLKIESNVIASSTTVPTTFTFSGLTVNAPSGTGPVTAEIVVGAAADCSGGTTVTVQGNPDFSTNGIEIYSVGVQTTNTRIAGSNADQTAVAALEFQYPPSPGSCIDQGTNPAPNRFNTGSTVIVATDGSWQDALTASYLASYFGTGVLLTPTGSLSPYTAEAIQNEGVSNVIIVGGTLAVSQAVQNQLAGTTAYLCGGGSPQTTALGVPIKLNVQRIAGNTADDTAQDVDTYVDSGYVGQVNIAAAFNKYNDTTGTDSGSSQTVPVRTAILVTDGFFQDAASASALAYHNHFPIVLTTSNNLSEQAETTLLDLGIQQVIELGGPLAISDSVNASLIAQGIAVLRIAGADGSETSVQLAKFELNPMQDGSGNAEGLGGSWDSGCVEHQTGSGQVFETNCHVVAALARGDFFADALTSSVVTGGGAFGANSTQPEPVILAENPTTLGTYATAFFNAAGSPYGIDPFFQGPNPEPGTGVTITSITVFGGPLAIANSTVQAALTAIAQG